MKNFPAFGYIRFLAGAGVVFLTMGSLALADPFEDALKAAQRGDYKTALQLWRPLAEKGNVDAQYNIGAIYAQGDGVTRDQTEALVWWRKAADGGSASAQNQLGFAYTYGSGVETNLAEGVRWYRLAAEQGNPIAQANLGAAYGAGRGIQQNWELSTKWYRLSAEHGFPLGLSNLGVAYMNGQGVQRDFVEAYKWLALAWMATPESDAEGKKIIEGNIQRLSAHMTSDEIKKARTLAEKWRPSGKPEGPYRAGKPKD